MTEQSPRLRPLVLLLTVLTFTAGLVDAVSVLGLGGVFTSLMTGNVVYLGLGLAGQGEASPFHSFFAIACFLAGAWLAARLGKRFTERPLRSWFFRTGLIETLALLACAAIALLADERASTIEGPTTRLVVIAILAFAMGVRTATILQVPVPDMKTTVLTLTLAGLAADVAKGEHTTQSLSRRLLSVATLCLGAFAGSILLEGIGAAATLVVMAVVVLGATLAFNATEEARRSVAELKHSTS